MADIEPMEASIRNLLKHLGEDPSREGLKDTPTRVVKAWQELCSGYQLDPKKLLTTFDGENYDEMISVGPINFYSTCEHHMLPFYGDAWVAYIPSKPVGGYEEIEPSTRLPYHAFDGEHMCCVFDPESPVHGRRPRRAVGSKIIGLSKLPRLVEIFARRLQNQERLTQQIVETLSQLLAPRGAACFIRAQHFCMMARGVRQQAAVMTTSKLIGVFQKPEVRAEFFELTKER